MRRGDKVVWNSGSLGLPVKAEVLAVGRQKVKIRYRIAGNFLEKWVMRYRVAPLIEQPVTTAA
jgi:hypothetical protein